MKRWTVGIYMQDAQRVLKLAKTITPGFPGFTGLGKMVGGFSPGLPFHQPPPAPPGLVLGQMGCFAGRVVGQPGLCPGGGRHGGGGGRQVGGLGQTISTMLLMVA